MLDSIARSVKQKNVEAFLVVVESGTHVEDAIKMLKPVVAVHNVRNVAITIPLSDVVDNSRIEVIRDEEPAQPERPLSAAQH